MTNRTPVLDRAIRLQNEVRRLEAGAQDQGQAQRIARRVAEIQAALAVVARHVRAARALQRRDAGATINLSGLDAGRDGLVRRAAGSIPSDPAFVAARRKIEATANRLAVEVQTAWKAWADQQLSALPDHMIAILPPDQQAAARTTLKNLRNLAAVKNITAPEIAEYASAYQSLMEELSETVDVPEAVATVMERISGRAATLRDLSDDEIALLREYRMDSEIELRRKSG